MDGVNKYNPRSTDIAVAIKVINYYQHAALLYDAMETYSCMKRTGDILDFYYDIVTFNENLEKK